MKTSKLEQTRTASATERHLQVHHCWTERTTHLNWCNEVHSILPPKIYHGVGKARHTFMLLGGGNICKKMALCLFINFYFQIRWDFIFVFYDRIGKCGDFSGLLHFLVRLTFLFCEKWVMSSVSCSLSLERNCCVFLIELTVCRTIAWPNGSWDPGFCGAESPRVIGPRAWVNGCEAEDQGEDTGRAAWTAGPTLPWRPLGREASMRRLQPDGFHWRWSECLRKETFNDPNQLSLQYMCF